MPAMPLIYRWYGQRRAGVVPEDPCACTGTRSSFLCRYGVYEPVTVEFCDGSIRNVLDAVRIGLSIESVNGSCGAYRIKDVSWIFHYSDFDPTLDTGKRAKSVTDADGNVWLALNTVFRRHTCTFKVTTRCVAIDANLNDLWDLVEITYQKDDCGAQQLIEGAASKIAVSATCKTGFQDEIDRQRRFTSEWELMLDPAQFDQCQQWQNYRFIDTNGTRYRVDSVGTYTFGDPVVVDIREDVGD